jgi:ankyrin repeat protein
MNADELLEDALDEEDADLVAEAIRQGADVNAIWEDQTFLSAATQIGKIELVRQLLSAGADPNGKNLDGTTALTWCGDAALTAALLDDGASALHEGGQRPEFFSLHNAAGDGDVARLRLLIERGDARYLLSTFDRDRRTPLHHAADGGHREAAQLLLDAGADPNLVEELFYTAISLAARRGDLDMVKLLLAGGADPTLDAGWQQSALDVARRHAGNPELLECLEEAVRQRGHRADRQGQE